MSDLTTSLKEIFNERISSPFYGSLIVSWLLWNWKIPYVTFFVDQSRLGDTTNKIDYIFKFCSNPWHLTLFPVLSAIVIITAMPLITNGASWITEIYDTWRVNKKNVVQGKRLLTVEESLQLRIKIKNQEEEFTKLFTEKDEEIKSLKEQLQEILKDKRTELKPLTQDDLYKDELSEFFKNKKILESFTNVSNRIQRGYDMQSVAVDIINYFVANDLIEGIGGGIFKFTEKGKYFLKEFTNKELKKITE